MSKAKTKSKALVAREAKEAASVIRYQVAAELAGQVMSTINAKAAQLKSQVKTAKMDLNGLVKRATAQGNGTVMDISQPKVKVARTITLARASYDERQEFLAKHSKAIAAEFAREPKGSWWNVLQALKLNDTLTGYTLNALGLIKTRDKRVTRLVEADKEFKAVVEKPKSKEAASVARFQASCLPSEVICGSLR